MLREDLKALIYAVHDTYGYDVDDEDKCSEILRILNSNGWTIIRVSELDDFYKQGMKDAVSNPEFADEYA
jgi:hypothetical protein